jgi:hypothetical protein
MILVFALPYVARMIGTCLHTQPMVEMGSQKLFLFLPTLVSNHDPPDICIPSSKDYRLEPLSPT